MKKTHGAYIAAALLLLVAPLTPAPAAVPKAPVAALCSVSAAPGEVKPPPQIEMAALPKDDRGRPELILTVVHDKDLFCYRYALDGTTYTVPPVMRMHPGDRFDLRVVNELSGPAAGARMTASQLKQCSAMPMPNVAPRTFIGYLNHPLVARLMPPMADTDVNMHFHGFQGPPGEENIFASTLSTPAHACEFAIDVPRTQPPGTYYYHPHAHGMADDEIAGGLSGMWIVDPVTSPIPRAQDHAVILTYRYPFVEDSAPMVDDKGLFISALARARSLKPAPAPSFDPFNPPLWPSVYPLRAGNTMLHAPLCGDRPGAWTAVDAVSAPAAMTLAANRPQLLRILNGTSDSIEYFHLRDEQGRLLPLDVVARDGVPVGKDFSHPLKSYEVSAHTEVVPAARVDVLVNLKPGQTLTLMSDRHCNGPFDEVQINRPLLVLHGVDAPPVADDAVGVTRITPSQSSAQSLVEYVKMHPSDVRKRAFTYTEYVLPKATGKGGKSSYYITETDNADFRETPFWPQYAKGATAPKPDVVVKQGTIEEWYLWNATLETHSFHIHQMDFAALDIPDAPALLDTVALRPATAVRNPHDPNYPLLKPSLTRVILDFRHVPKGTFVFHCHMLFHEDRGMMKVVRVE